MAEQPGQQPTIPPSAFDPDLKATERVLFGLTTKVIYASENGLFSEADWKYKNKIDEAIIRADLAIKDKKYADAYAATYEAQRLFDEAWNAAPKCWRICYERGWLHHLFTFLGAGMAVIVLWVLWQGEICNIDKSSALFGFLGAVVRSLYWTTSKANLRMLRRVWAVQNFFGPLIGLILGGVAYFIIRSGLVLITQDKAQPNAYLSGVLEFYAGFNWDWILGLLKKAANETALKSDTQKGSSGK